MTGPVDLGAVLSRSDEPWQSHMVAVRNDHDVRVVRTHGEFARHSHPGTDEVFLVLSGSLTIRMDDGAVTPGPASSTSSRGAPHRPFSRHGAEVLLVEPSTTVTTGDSPGELTTERRLA